MEKKQEHSSIHNMGSKQLYNFSKKGYLIANSNTHADAIVWVIKLCKKQVFLSNKALRSLKVFNL